MISFIIALLTTSIITADRISFFTKAKGQITFTSHKDSKASSMQITFKIQKNMEVEEPISSHATKLFLTDIRECFNFSTHIPCFWNYQPYFVSLNNLEGVWEYEISGTHSEPQISIVRLNKIIYSRHNLNPSQFNHTLPPLYRLRTTMHDSIICVRLGCSTFVYEFRFKLVLGFGNYT